MPVEIGRSLYKFPPLSDMVVVAHLWLLRGWGLLPAQPGSKKLIRGYGPHLARIETADQLEAWFRMRKCNLAVIAPPDGLILDFDDPWLYTVFQDKSPSAARSLTERTPDGGAHVFVHLANQVGFEPVKGLEIKRFALVYPSRIAGKQYGPSVGKIERIDLQEALLDFGTVKALSSRSVAPGHSCGQIGGVPGPIADVKQQWPILRFMSFFAPRVRLSGSGRFRSAKCPWHPDEHPSMWVDSERGTWGCHGCGAHGDILNWLQLQNGFSTKEAIKYLVEYSQAVRFEA